MMGLYDILYNYDIDYATLLAVLFNLSKNVPINYAQIEKELDKIYDQQEYQMFIKHKKKGLKMVITNNELNLFERTHKAIVEVRDKIKDMTLEQAANALGGYNYDGELFDYDYPIDEGYYFVGTIHNQDGKAIMDADRSFYDVWYAIDMLNARQVLAMTENEILEQISRLQ